MKKDDLDKIPSIRFRGFTDAWEQRKLGDTVKRVTRKNKEMLSTLPLTISAQDGLIDQNEYFNKIIASKDVSGYYLIKNGEFAYNKSYSSGYPWGAIKRLDSYNMGVLSTLYIVFKPIDVDSHFLAKYYDTTYWHKEVSKHAAEGARNHGLLNIAASDFFQTELRIPNNEDEQMRIGTFFQSLDDLITLHQRKLDKTKELKKTMLSKMFPKKGEGKPELRFSGFADAWELRKLIDIVNRVNKSSNSNVLPKVEFEDIVSGEGRLNKDVSLKLDDRKGTAFEPKNILYGKLRPYLKNWLFPNFSGVALGDFWVFQATNISVPSFDYYLIQSENYQKVANDTSGTKMPRSDWKNVSSTDFAIPGKREQQQIGTFFQSLDNLITLHQRELEQFKNIKKTLLKHMFV